MAQGFSGANADELDDVANEAEDGSRRIDKARVVLGSQLAAAPWRGQGADAFRERWHSEYARTLAATEAFLEEAAAALRRNAAEQREASAGAGGAGGAGGGRGSKPLTPLEQRRADLEERYQQAREHMRDDLGDARSELEELRRLRKEAGGVGSWIADRNPFDEGETERLDRLIREKEDEIRRLEELLKDPTRKFLLVDASGDGRIIEVKGDLALADEVAIHIPGMGTDIDDYLSKVGNGDANQLYERMQGVANGKHVAVIQFLDYDAPGDLSGSLEDRARALAEAGGEGLARDGADHLRSLVVDLDHLGVGGEKISVVCHSYGSVVTGLALADGMDVKRVVTIGSPGLGNGVDDISDLHTRAEVWSAKGSKDFVPYLPGHGEDPSARGFGAKGFDAGGVDHSHYFEGPVLNRIANIVVHGSPPESSGGGGSW